VYKYLATAVAPKLVGVGPWAVGAEVTIPVIKSGKDYVLQGGVYSSGFGERTLLISLTSAERFDILGISDDGSLVIGEVKNMAGPRRSKRVGLRRWRLGLKSWRLF